MILALNCTKNHNPEPETVKAKWHKKKFNQDNIPWKNSENHMYKVVSSLS